MSVIKLHFNFKNYEQSIKVDQAQDVAVQPFVTKLIVARPSVTKSFGGKLILLILLIQVVSGCGKHDHQRVIYEKKQQTLNKVEEVSSETILLKSIQTNDLSKFNLEYSTSQCSVNFELPTGRPLLHEAIIWNSIEIVKFLVQSGADLELKDKEGKTALDLAQGKAQILKLIKPGPAVAEIQNFFILIEKNQFNELKKILNQGFDPNIMSEQGETGLIYAIKLKLENTVRVLLQAQIALDVNQCNLQGERPLLVASTLGLKRIEQMLRSKGAKEFYYE